MTYYLSAAAEIRRLCYRRRSVLLGPVLVSRIRRDRHYHNSLPLLHHRCRRDRKILIHPHTIAGNIPNTCSGILRC